MVTKITLLFFAWCSLVDYMQADIVYASVSSLPIGLTPPPADEIQHNFKFSLPHEGQLVRPQRSLYGGWHGPPVHPQPLGLGQISKEELITLLEAAKEVTKPAPEPEPEPEPEAEAEPEPEPAPAPAAEGAAPPAGVPLTVSLPAFVPIQLSAMYTAPPPAAAPAAPAAPEEGAEEEEEEEEAEEEEEEEEDEEEEPEEELAPAPVIKPYHPIYHPWSSRGLYGGRRVVQFSPRYAKKSRSKTKSKARKAKSKKTKSKSKSRSKKRTGRKLKSRKNNLRYAGSQQSLQVLPPPPFLSRAPGPLKLVPSNQLLSNWN